MRPRSLPVAALAATLLTAVAPPLPNAIAASTAASAAAPTAENVQLVGRNALYARGMNAAPAIYGNYIYIGSRTDASEGHPHPGVLVVNIADPAHPSVVGEIGPPNAGNVGETSRELRVWPQQRLLIVMNFTCSSLIHECAGVPVTSTIKFYDLSDPARPTLVATYVPSAGGGEERPHEMFLWVDPQRPNRALLYMSTPTNAVDDVNMIVTDISRAREGVLPEVATFNANARFPARVRENRDVALHSVALNYRGTRAYLSYLGGGFLIADTTDLARNVANPRIRLITPVGNRVRYTNPGAHSAVEVPGRQYALLTEEVYGDYLDELIGADEHGCPWGWVKLADISNPSQPRVVGEYRIRQNHPSYCRTPAGRDPRNTRFTSYSAHNPTVLPNLALVTWHSGGLQVISVANPADPQRTGVYSPRPLDGVATEDPALSAGRNKVVFWSYPIIKDGLIYLTDVRNGLYVLRYTGPGAAAVRRITFYEGNSNLGDAARLFR